MRLSIPRGPDSLLVAIDREVDVPGLRADFSSNGFSMLLSCLSLNNSVRKMFVGKDYRAVDMLFSIIEAYYDRATEFQTDTYMAGIHHIYFSSVSKVVSQHCDRW